MNYIVDLCTLVIDMHAEPCDYDNGLKLPKGKKGAAIGQADGAPRPAGRRQLHRDPAPMRINLITDGTSVPGSPISAVAEHSNLRFTHINTAPGGNRFSLNTCGAESD